MAKLYLLVDVRKKQHLGIIASACCNTDLLHARLADGQADGCLARFD